MFILTKLADLVQIHPKDFEKHSADAIEDNINEKYSNHVLHKIGLCISLYDIIWTSEGLIGHGTGMVNVNVEFRMIVFRPFKGEVILARIRSLTPEGMHLRTDFFDDIFVPFDELPPGTEYNHSQQHWVWDIGEDRLPYRKHDMVRVAVIDEEWFDQTPEGPDKDKDEERIKTPYRIKGSMMAEGLGPCEWWD